MHLSSLQACVLPLAVMAPAGLALAGSGAAEEGTARAWIGQRCPAELQVERQNVFGTEMLDTYGDMVVPADKIHVFAWMTVLYGVDDLLAADYRIDQDDAKRRRDLRASLAGSVALAECVAPDAAEAQAMAESMDSSPRQVAEIGRNTLVARQIIDLLDTEGLAGEALQARITDTWEAALPATVEKN